MPSKNFCSMPREPCWTAGSTDAGSRAASLQRIVVKVDDNTLHGTPPTVTSTSLSTVEKECPVIVTTVPPAILPTFGETAATRGANDSEYGRPSTSYKYAVG